MEMAVFGGGCFWCTEAVFQRLSGVQQVDSGYAGGVIGNPQYDLVSQGDTGYVEVIQVTFDPQIISYDILLDVFFATHDPTTLNQQGADVGTQYASAIFTTSDIQTQTALAKIKQLNASEYAGKITTVVRPLEKFYTSEQYHKNYYNKNSEAPYCSIVIAPKLQKLLKKFPMLIKETH